MTVVAAVLLAFAITVADTPSGGDAASIPSERAEGSSDRRTQTPSPRPIPWKGEGVTGTGAEDPPQAPSPPPSPAKGEGEDGDAAKADDSTAKPDAAFVVVEGQVTDHIGVGHKGVRVAVHRKGADGGPGELIGTAETDAVGDFKVTSATTIRGEIVVVFTKPMHATLVRSAVRDEDSPPFLGETLQGDLVLKGQVVDALADRPVAGASVTLSAAENEWTVKTDDEGRFAIKQALPGKGTLVASAEKFGREQKKIAKIEEQGEITVRLKPERTVELRVVDDLNRPAAAATVELVDGPRNDFRTAVTDAEGVAKFRGIHFDAAVLNVRLTHPDLVSDVEMDRELDLPSDKVESNHSLTMPRAATITGRITSATTGKPLNGARVVAGAVASDSLPRDWSDHEGRFEIHGVPPGEAVVTVHLGDYSPDLKTVTARAGVPTSVAFALLPAAVVNGVVKDHEGKVVEGVLIEAARWRGAGTLGLRTISGSDGTFAIENAPRDEFTIEAISPDGTSAALTTVRAENGKVVEISLKPPTEGTERTRNLIKEGDVAPEFQLTTLNGETLTTAGLKGKLIVLDFWATWCGPCVAEAPEIIQIYEKFASRKDFVMIGVSLDDREGDVRTFVKKLKINWPQAVGEKGGVPAARTAYRISGIPSVFVIAKDGTIAGADVHGDRLIECLTKALGPGDSP